MHCVHSRTYACRPWLVEIRSCRKHNRPLITARTQRTTSLPVTFVGQTNQTSFYLVPYCVIKAQRGSQHRLVYTIWLSDRFIHDFETTRQKEDSERRTLYPTPRLVAKTFSKQWLPHRPATDRPVALLHPEEQRAAVVAEKRDQSPSLSKSSRPLGRAFRSVYYPAPR